MSALGFIETKGLIGAIEAADAMLKAADVRLLEKNLVGGGLVTITVAGEVSAVRAAVDAAVATIGRINGATLVSEHVIARPDVELAAVIAIKPGPDPVKAPPAAPVSSKPKQEQPAAPAQPAPAPKAVAPVAITVPDSPGVSDAPVKSEQSVKSGQTAHDAAQLKKMSLNRLRQVAQSLSGLSIPREKIASVDKKVLIEAILNVYRQIEE